MARTIAVPAPPSPLTPGIAAWLSEYGERNRMTVGITPLEALNRWQTDQRTGDISHRSGRFFTVTGLDVHVSGSPLEHWRQPIMDQPDIGILGLLVKRFGGVPHLLVQAKVEPGNCNGVQLSPTVQATRSNYTRVHAGRAVPYLEYFQQSERHIVHADVRQSEHGTWFYRKRNRNMVVEVTGEVEVLEGFRWLTAGELGSLLAVDNLVNMDTRTVLGCLPMPGPGPHDSADPHDARTGALVASITGERPARHDLDEILRWLTAVRSRREVLVRPITLSEVAGWGHRDGRISHDEGLFFDVIGVDVEATGREVARWSQPIFAPRGLGLNALLVRRVDGVLHVLVQARVEPGYLDVVEVAPTVQCTPDTYDRLPRAARPLFLDEVLAAEEEQILFDVIHSEEGGRLYHARNRYLVVESRTPAAVIDHPDYRWVTLRQLGALMRHSHYVNVQVRSLVACLRGLAGHTF
ncbi:NDP-hexose 2,3-dehydratase family protein [Actinoplanes sp. NPDC048988]|uniref:NDP-hexose 2,3-dehydratase family protein n=1 Tax=Actinoplanes sp. NPDC048988 TaxID=3363901 RepID=UPI00371B2B7E